MNQYREKYFSLKVYLNLKVITMGSKNSSGKTKITSRKRSKTQKSIFVDLEDVAYEKFKIPKRKLESGKYLKDMLNQTAAPNDVKKAIALTVDALLDSISKDLKSLSAAALVPHPESGNNKAIVRGKLDREIVKKILEIFRKYPPVINDLLGSEDEVKVLDTGIGYVVLENCQKDNYLVGIVQDQSDVDELARRLKHVQKVVLENTLLLDAM